MPAWVCACACVCVCACQLRPQASWPKSTRACMLEVCSSCVCVCVCVGTSLLVDCTNTYTVCLSPPLLAPWRSQLICRLMANQCAANVSNGAAAVPHTITVSLGSFILTTAPSSSSSSSSSSGLSTCWWHLNEFCTFVVDFGVLR